MPFPSYLNVNVESTETARHFEIIVRAHVVLNWFEELKRLVPGK